MKNDQNGFVRTIYIGNFTNSNFDDSGNAEEIVYYESVNKYFHYVGSFTEGSQDNNNNNALTYITQKEINKIIEPLRF